MNSDGENCESDDEIEIFRGMALHLFLRVNPRSFIFQRYVHRIANAIRHVYPNCRPIYFDQDLTEYKSFISDLKGFLRDIDCPYTEFTTSCIYIAIQNKSCRRRLLHYLNAEYTSAMKYDNFYLRQIDKSESSSGGISKDTLATPSCTNVKQDTVPNNERNVGPGEEQSPQIPQVVDEPAQKLVVYEAAKKRKEGDEPPKMELVDDEPTKTEATLENKFGELTIDTEQPFLSLIPTLQPNYAPQVHCSTGMAQYGNIDNNFQQCSRMQGSLIQNDSYRNIRSNQYILPNQQQCYQPPAFNHNFNFAFPQQQYTLSSQAVRPNQTDCISPLNQNSQGIWNRHMADCNEGLLQGANQNRGLNDNIRYNLNHQWNRNVPSSYSHNQYFNIPQQQDVNHRPEYWNTRGSENIPFSQNYQQGLINQGPRNTSMTLFGNSYNDQNQRIYGNMQHQLNNQQSYRPPAYQNVNFSRPQETYVRHRNGASYYINNITIYHGQQGGNAQSGLTGVGALNSGLDYRFQQRGNMPQRENQNPSFNGYYTNSQGPRF